MKKVSVLQEKLEDDKDEVDYHTICTSPWNSFLSVSLHHDRGKGRSS
jgi:hypothetical protein